MISLILNFAWCYKRYGISVQDFVNIAVNIFKNVVAVIVLWSIHFSRTGGLTALLIKISGF